MGRPHGYAACLVRNLVVAAIALTSGVCPAQSADVADMYGQAMARSAEHERGGDLAAATTDLLVVLPSYPQDYEIVLRLGWLYCRSQRFADAQRMFRLALSRGGGAAEPTLGLRLCPLPRFATFDATASLVVQFYSGQQRSPSLGFTAHLSALLAGRFVLGATYRYRDNVPAVLASGPPLFGQHEAYLDAGYGNLRGGITLRYALLADQGGLGMLSHHVGATARYSPYGDILLDLSGSFYPDLTVLRGAPSWRLPIRWGLSVQPGLAVEWTPLVAQPRPLVSGFLGVALSLPRFSVSLGGKYGNEVRPAYLEVPVIYNLPETLTYGAWAGASVSFRGFHLGLSYALDRLQPPNNGAGSAGSFLHAIALGLSRGF